MTEDEDYEVMEIESDEDWSEDEDEGGDSFLQNASTLIESAIELTRIATEAEQKSGVALDRNSVMEIFQSATANISRGVMDMAKIL